MTTAMRQYSPGEITMAVQSLASADENALRVLACLIAGSIITGEMPLNGGNLILDLLGCRRVELPRIDEEYGNEI